MMASSPLWCYKLWDREMEATGTVREADLEACASHRMGAELVIWSVNALSGAPLGLL